VGPSIVIGYGQGQEFFSSPKRPGPLWGPPSLVQNLYPRTKRPFHQLTSICCRG